MNILYTFLNFNSLTGSELYYYELSKEMVKRGHNVTIISNCGGEIASRAYFNGVKCRQFSEFRSFSEFDIIHASHIPVIKGLSLHTKINKPIICTVHSEILEIEKVHKCDNAGLVDHYIGIRPAIFNELPSSKSDLIFNPIDFSRFNKEGCTNSHDLIFVPGTVNYLRQSMIFDLLSTYGAHYNIAVMGKNEMDVSFDSVHYMHEDFNIEDVIKKSFAIAGIIKGRTYIEAMACGKTYFDYQIDEKGVINDIKIYAPSDELEFNGIKVNLSEFDSKIVAEKIEKIYFNYL